MMIESNKDQRWMFAREFDPSVFINMSYNENNLLCNLAAVMIDITKSGESISESSPGPTYTGIIALRQNAKSIGAIGFHIAHSAHKYLTRQFSFKGVTDVTAKFINDFDQQRTIAPQPELTEEERLAMFAGFIAEQEQS